MRIYEVEYAINFVIDGNDPSWYQLNWDLWKTVVSVRLDCATTLSDGWVLLGDRQKVTVVIPDSVDDVNCAVRFLIATKHKGENVPEGFLSDIHLIKVLPQCRSDLYSESS